MEFPISAAQGTTSASFDGGGWALRNNASYAAYYPFSVWNYHRDNETILLDYSGQVQDGNGSFSHLSAYDFLASDKTTPQNSSVTFQMVRQGSILYIDIVVPEPETITALTISCDEAIFVEKAALDISGDTPVVSPIEMTKSLTLSFVNTVTTTDDETVRAYMAVQPLDFRDKTVTATLYTATGRYEAPVTPRVVNKGRAAFLRFSDAFSPVNIEFADDEVKRLCVEYWDTDHDGELSYKEAAAVTDLGDVFTSNGTISSFDELQYFTGLTEIPSEAFRLCGSLASVIIPGNVAVLGNDAFAYCAFEEIVLPESLTSIGNDAFIGTQLRQVTIPQGVTSLGTGVFDMCWNLESFNGKLASADGHSLVVDGCLYANATSGLTVYVIPSGITTIKTRSVSLASPESVIIPEGVTYIEELAFFITNTQIETITLPNSLEVLGSSNFICRYLSSFSGKFASADGRCLIESDELIGFAPAGLTEYAIPQGVKAIGIRVFQRCPIAKVIIPDDVTNISWAAFYASEINQITLPSALETIGGIAFCNCSNITELVIPANVGSIGVQAFMGCTGLTKVTVNNPVPIEIDEGVFDNTNDCPIYVPNASVDAYKFAPGWSDYSGRIFGINVDGSVVGPDPQNPD